MTRFLSFLTLATVVALLLDRNPADRIPDLVRLLGEGEAVRWGAAALLLVPTVAWALRGRRPALHAPLRAPRAPRAPRRRERPLVEVARRRGLAQDAVRVSRARARAAFPSGRHETPRPPDPPPAAPSGESPLVSPLRAFSALFLSSARSLRKAEP